MRKENLYRLIFTIIKARDYKKTITIKKIGNEKKCLTFRWSKAKLDGKMIDDNSYTYCPKKGFTKMYQNLEK